MLKILDILISMYKILYLSVQATVLPPFLVSLPELELQQSTECPPQASTLDARLVIWKEMTGMGLSFCQMHIRRNEGDLFFIQSFIASMDSGHKKIDRLVLLCTHWYGSSKTEQSALCWWAFITYILLDNFIELLCFWFYTVRHK